MSSGLSGEHTIQAAEAAISTEIEGESVVLHRNSGVYYGVEHVGATIWQLIQEPQTVDDIVDEVVARFDVDRDRCRSDTIAFLENLLEEDLIEVRE